MEHLKGNQMKRDVRSKLAAARASMLLHSEESETDTDAPSPNKL